jgi:hypothetical protein
MKKIYKTILIFGIIIIPYLSISQEKKTPDDFNGFREFEFHKTITDYYSYKYKFIESSDNYSTYEIILPDNETQFLETRINKVLIKQYKKKIVEVTLFLRDDVEEILSRMFKSSYQKNNNYDYNNFYRYNPSLNNQINIQNLTPSNEWQQPEIDTTWDSELFFKGYNTNMGYGIFEITKEYSINKNDNQYPTQYIRETKTIQKNYYLRFSAKDYKDKIDSKQVQVHYDTYLSDFGVKHHPKENENKSYYTIPLFEFENIYYVRALFGDVVENLIFDTGADQLVISKSLYTTLKSKNLVTDEGSSIDLVLANGELVNLKKVMLKDFQLYDLKIEFIEAYVNTSDDISLLGQSFLKRFGGISIDYKLNVLIIKK